MQACFSQHWPGSARGLPLLPARVARALEATEALLEETLPETESDGGFTDEDYDMEDTQPADGRLHGPAQHSGTGDADDQVPPGQEEAQEGAGAEAGTGPPGGEDLGQTQGSEGDQATPILPKTEAQHFNLSKNRPAKPTHGKVKL